MRVREVMRDDPVAVPPTATVAEARAAAETAGSRHALVLQGNTVIGVLEEERLWLSAEDVLRTAAGLQGSLTARDEEPVRRTMRPAVPAVSSAETLETAARLMLLKDRVAVPVVDNGRLVGILSVDECRQALGAPLKAVPGQGDEHRNGGEREEDEASGHAVA